MPEARQRTGPRLRSLAAAALVGATAALMAAGPAGAEPTQHDPVVAGGIEFSVTSAPVSTNSRYQISYSAETKSLWTTGASPPTSGVAKPWDISEVDEETLSVTAKTNLTSDGPYQVPGRGTYGLLVDDARDLIWTTSTGQNELLVFDRNTGELKKTLPNIWHGRDIVLDTANDSNPANDRVWVSSPTRGSSDATGWSVQEINANTQTFIAEHRLSGNRYSPMSLDIVTRDGQTYLYSISLDSGELVEYNTVTGATREFATGPKELQSSGVAVDPGRGYAYVARQGNGAQANGSVVTVDLNAADPNNAVINEAFAANTPSGQLNVAVDAEKGYVYATNFWGSTILVINADTGDRIGEIPVTTRESGDPVKSSPNDVVVANGSAWAVDRDTARPDGQTRIWRITPGEETDDPDTPLPGDPDTPQASVTLDGTPRVGGTVTLTGQGWLHPSGTEGSRIAVKLDAGRFRGVDLGSVPADVWQVIDADAQGNFSVSLRLPNGTTDIANGGSDTPYEAGEHWLNLLTGSLKQGDQIRSVRVDLNVLAAESGGQPQQPISGQGGNTPAAAPSNSALPSIAGTTRFGGTLTARPGTWANGDGATYAYQWLRAGKPIAKATGRTYVANTADVGKRLSVRVTATTAAGSATAQSAVKTVTAAKPTVKITVTRQAARARAVIRLTAGKRYPTAGVVRVLVNGRVVATQRLTAARRGVVRATLPVGARSRGAVRVVYGGSKQVSRANKGTTLRPLSASTRSRAGR